MHDFLAGIVSGTIQTFVGHPFDTLKIWQQNKTILKYPTLNFKNLFKGIKIPIVQNPLLIGTTIYTNSQVYEKYKNIYFSSFCSGVVSSILYTPLDYLKINLQQQNSLNIYKSYNRFNIVMMHEIPANMIFFSSYKILTMYEINNNISGALSGFFCSIIIYPINTIKTRMQSDLELTLYDVIKKKNLYNGIKYSLVRSVLCGAIGLPIFEKLKSYD